ASHIPVGHRTPSVARSFAGKGSFLLRLAVLYISNFQRKLGGRAQLFQAESVWRNTPVPIFILTKCRRMLVLSQACCLSPTRSAARRPCPWRRPLLLRPLPLRLPALLVRGETAKQLAKVSKPTARSETGGGFFV